MVLILQIKADTGYWNYNTIIFLTYKNTVLHQI